MGWEKMEGSGAGRNWKEMGWEKLEIRVDGKNPQLMGGFPVSG